MSSTLSSPPLVDSSSQATTRSRASQLGGVFKLAEMCWAGLALALFLVGGALQLAGAPAWSWWALYLGCGRPGPRSWTWIC